MSKTIIKRQEENKGLLVEKLKTTPIVQVVCQKVGIGRATYYRWRKEDKEFTKLADEALSEGRSFINDMAESQLIASIKEGNMTGLIYWLKHNHPTYTTRVEITTNNHNSEISLTDEQKELLDKALEMVAVTPTEDKNDE